MLWLLVATSNYGDNNYTTNEAMSVALTIRFDNAVQSSVAVPGPGGVGSRNIRSTASTSAVGQNGIALP